MPDPGRQITPGSRRCGRSTAPLGTDRCQVNSFVGQSEMRRSGQYLRRGFRQVKLDDINRTDGEVVLDDDLANSAGRLGK